MKRKLNLNAPAPRVAAAVALFLVVVPVLLYLLTPVYHALHLPVVVQRLLMRTSLAVGALLAASFAALIAVEQIQDRHVDRVYRRNRHRTLKLTNGYYECQYCGNRWLRETDGHCPVCGRTVTPGC